MHTYADVDYEKNILKTVICTCVCVFVVLGGEGKSGKVQDISNQDDNMVSICGSHMYPYTNYTCLMSLCVCVCM